MQVQVISRHHVTHDLHDLAVRRIRFAMCRLSWLVPRASVQFSDVNGHRGGVDKRCQIQFSTHRSGSVVVTSVARDWREALDGALTRARHALLRTWRRQGETRGRARRDIEHAD